MNIVFLNMINQKVKSILLPFYIVICVIVTNQLLWEQLYDYDNKCLKMHEKCYVLYLLIFVKDKIEESVCNKYCIFRTYHS